MQLSFNKEKSSIFLVVLLQEKVKENTRESILLHKRTSKQISIQGWHYTRSCTLAINCIKINSNVLEYATSKFQNSHFQTEAKSKTFLVKMSFI